MRLALLIVIIALSASTIQGATVPTVNPECQSLADIINDIKRRLDQVPLTLLPIPGLNASLPTTLKCHEYTSCTGFNCSGSVYGTHVEFSFNFDFCLKPISANISLYYPAEKVNFTRTIQHGKEFFISRFVVKIPVLSTSIDLPIQLYGKIDMIRGPGRVVVSAGIIPKFSIVIPVPLQPFYFLTNQIIYVDTSRCDVNTTLLPMTQETPSRPPQGSTTSVPSVRATSIVRQTSRQPTSGSSNTQRLTTVPPGQATNQAVGSNGALTGGEVAAIVMGFVALLTIIIFAILFVRKRKARQQNQTSLESANGNRPETIKVYYAQENAKESTNFGTDEKASVVASNHYENLSEKSTNPKKEGIVNPQFEVHGADGISNPYIESEQQFQF